MRLAPVFLAVTMFAALAGGCSSPRATFYRLNGDASLTAITARPPARPVIVGPVTVPELVDRPQIVTRGSGNEVALNEYARWGAPLNSGIADTIAANLTLLLGSDRVAVATRAIADPDAWRVRVDIQQFESIPGDAVVIDAHWTVRGLSLADEGVSGRSLVREPVNGTDWDALVAAHDRALATVSREIAAAMVRSASP